MYEVYKEFRFEAAHSLPYLPVGHKCRNVHGHSYVIQVHVRGPVDLTTGFVIDFAEISKAWKPLLDLLDHQFINDVLGLEQSTSENLARWIWMKLKPSLNGICKVVVQETKNSGCVYYGPIGVVEEREEYLKGFVG